MKTLIIALIFLLIGSATGGFLALAYGYHLGAATGLILGSQAGVCLAVETVETQGLVTDAAEVDGLIATAIGRIREHSPPIPPSAGLEWIDQAAQCRGIVHQLVAGPGAKPPESAD
ncbi:MAG: hypothetical protein EOM91_13430 [Sphingobacteriia bacterium]|nr:hypothetical protein [Sphingobacteriia bacterium]NCC40190.1 hypothetical protein [Gammaproteobacteria bacterium]